MPPRDYIPGVNFADDIQLLDDETSTVPESVGIIALRDGTVYIVDSEGAYNPRSGGSGISESEHEALDTLTHQLTASHVATISRSAGKITSVLAEVTEGGTDIREMEVLTRTSGKVETFRVTQYAADGVTIKRQMDYALTRSAGKVSKIDATRTV